MRQLVFVFLAIIVASAFAQQLETLNVFYENEKMDQNSKESVDQTTDSPTTLANFNVTETPVLPMEPVWSNGNATETNVTDGNSTDGHRAHHKKGCKKGGKFQDQNLIEEEGERHSHRREDSENEEASSGFEGKQERKHGKKHHGQEERRHHHREEGRRGRHHEEEGKRGRHHGHQGRPHNHEGKGHHNHDKDGSNSTSTFESSSNYNSTQDPTQLLQSANSNSFAQTSEKTSHSYSKNSSSSQKKFKHCKGLRVGLSIAGGILGLVVLIKLVRCCKRRRLIRKQRREALLQAALQQQTQQSLLNGSVNLGYPLLPNQSISVGQPYNPQQPQIIYVPYPYQVSQQNQQQPNNVASNEQIGEPIAVNAPQQHSLSASAPPAPHQNFMQIEIPSIQQPQLLVAQQQELAANNNNNRARYPVLAPMNVGGVQQMPILYGYPQQQQFQQ